MANPEHLVILKKSVQEWNNWKVDNYFTDESIFSVDLRSANLSELYLDGIDLSYADLSGANLSQANLSYANLRGAKLRRANLENIILMYANLSHADLYESNSNYADFSGADLSEAYLRSADLRNVNFLNANLFQADLNLANLSHAYFCSTVLGDLDLSICKGLDTCIHGGPSSIGVDTLFKSINKIPLSFLKGIGLTNEFIEYMPSLYNKSFQLYTCFISHSSKDKLFSEKLYNDLQRSGVRCWYFPEDAKWGKSVWAEIDNSIRIYDKLMVVCSENSLNSGPVLREIERALQKEDRENKNVLFPIAIDNYVFDKWKHERKADVLNKVVGDFKCWDNDIEKYNTSFSKLIMGLRTN